MPTHDEESQPPSVPAGVSGMRTVGTRQMPTASVQVPAMVLPAQLVEVYDVFDSCPVVGVSSWVRPICGESCGTISASADQSTAEIRSRSERITAVSLGKARRSRMAAAWSFDVSSAWVGTMACTPARLVACSIVFCPTIAILQRGLRLRRGALTG